MILQQLYQDAERILKTDLPPPMYDTKPVRWVIRLSAEGKMLGFLSQGGDKENKRGIPRLVPYVGRTSAVKAILLADSPAYVLGIDEANKRPFEKHVAFKSLIHDCATDTQNPLVNAVDTFLHSWNPAEAETPSEMTSADLITFLVDDQWPVDMPEVREFWGRVARALSPESASGIGQCLVTGVIGPTEKSLPGVLKRIPGGQMSGVALISANESAFESYGLERAQTSPISAEAAERFTKALNKLIEGKRTHITLGNLVYVFWTRQGANDDLIDLIDDPQEEQVKMLLDSYRVGKPFAEVDKEAFYAFALSASSARAVIRDWLQTTVGEAKGRLARWFEAHEIVDSYGDGVRHFNLYRLAASAYRDPRKEMPVQVPQALMRAALHGEPVPQSLLNKAVLRCRAERAVTPARAALIKAVLVKTSQIENRGDATLMTRLDTQNDSPAYLYGRLLAELDAVQRAALGKVNATLVDRYFGAASTTPATVFGILLTNANKAHLPKICKQNEGVYNALQRRIEEIVTPLGDFKRTLTLQEQALFSLGYYHQRAEDRAAAIAAKERKKQGKSTEADDALIDIVDETPETEDN